MKKLHLMLSDQAAAALASDQTNGSLRQWLIEAYFHAQRDTDQATLFGQDVPVSDEIPPLVAATSQATRSRAEELIEAWAREYQRDPAAAAPSSTPTDAAVAEVLDLLQTLFEETVQDAQRRYGAYPEGEHLLESAERLFETLRQLIASRATA